MRDSGIANVRMDEYWNAGLLDLGVSYSATLDEETSAGTTVATCERVHVACIAQARASEELICGAQETIKCEFLPAMLAYLAERAYPIDNDADFPEAVSAPREAPTSQKRR